MCEQVNATHCQCLLDDMRCDNLQCLHKSKFCDGVNDCGDFSDEPENCESDCSLALAAYDETKICDNEVQCKGINDFGKYLNLTTLLKLFLKSNHYFMLTSRKIELIREIVSNNFSPLQFHDKYKKP